MMRKSTKFLSRIHPDCELGTVTRRGAMRGLHSLLLLLLAGAGIGALNAVTSNPTRQASLSETPPLHVDPLSLTFGPVWGEGIHTHSLLLTNQSTGPVRVTRVTPASCACTSVRGGSFELDAGESRTLAVEIDLNRAPIVRTRVSAQQFSSALDFHFQDGGRQRVAITGQTMQPLVIVPNPLSFGAPIRFEAQVTGRRFSVRKHPRIRELTVTLDSTKGRLRSIRELSTDSEEFYEVAPSLVDRPVGPWSFNVEVRAVADDGRVLGPQILPVHGRVEADVEWAPEIILLVVDPSAGPESEDVVFSSRSGTSFELTQIRTAPDCVHAEIVDVQAQTGLEENTVGILHVEPIREILGRSEHGQIVVELRSLAHERDVLASIPVTVSDVTSDARSTNMMSNSR